MLLQFLLLEQISKVVQSLDKSTPSIVSIFAGRIADTGRDPEPFMKYAYKIPK